ncbi:MAG TPA: indolepyruvate oxidoreductase subunit beta family protein [Methylomirabilota bacterium]|nr:indolepyruvate oxidoreductase subunit beta family protein [Methylomirabilota bacterium]
MDSGSVLSLLIPAVGGQGGGVLSEWIVDAAALDGYRVHGTSIPGVAQRTGSTTYYVELFADRESVEDPAFSLYPVPGALDVLVAPEFLEVGRMIEAGFVSPARTTVVCSTHRLYSIHEKIATGRALYPQADLDALARRAARRLVAFDALAAARERGTEVNAVLLGALAGSGALPITIDAYRKAIESRGVQVEANLKGFNLGLELAQPPDRPATTVVADSANERVRATAATPRANEGVWGKPQGSPNQIEQDFAADLNRLPESLHAIVREALPRLIDYQDAAYARRYLERLRPLLAHESVAAIVARHLALWMTYEDAIRVAQAKTRAARFARIRAETRAGNAEIEVTDYLKPDLDEIWGILPHRLVAPFARWAERRWPHGRPTLGQHVKTTTVSGYLRVWLLARLRRLRPVSWRARVEHERMERWLATVARTASRDEALACEVARLARLVKGYGDVRRRLVAVFDAGLSLVARAGEGQARGTDVVSTALVARFSALVLEGPDGEARALALANEAAARLDAGDLDGARALVAR